MARDTLQFVVPQEALPSWQLLSPRADATCRANQSRSSRLLFFWARNAIFHGLKAMAISRGARVLVPAYICKAAVEPIEAYGGTVDFYEVRRDGTLDLGDIESKLRLDTRALMVVHYFGFPSRIAELRNLCDQRGIKLIEDCAHVLTGESGGQSLGSFGDISVFSWRKFFPLYDGGELRLNFPAERFKVEWDSETLPFTLSVAKGMFDQLPNPLLRKISAAASSVKGIAKRIKGAPARGVDTRGVDSRSAGFDAKLVNRPISRVSRWLFTHSNFAEVLQKRRHNYALLEKELAERPGLTPLFPALPEGVCPWIFPVFFDGRPNAHLALRQRGIPAVAWEGVRPLKTDPARFPQADFLYENLVFLPVHQSLSEQDLSKIIEAVKDVLRGCS